MDNYWQEKWQAGDTRFHQSKPHPQLLKHFESLAAGRVMVPLCGKSLDMLWLKSKGHEVVGAELSPIACEAFFRENSLPFEVRKQDGFEVYQGDRVALWCGDFFELPSSVWRDVSAVYDRAALIALPAPIRKQYAKHVIQAAGSVEMLLITIEYPANALEGPPFSVTESEVKELYSSAWSVELLESLRDTSLAEKNSKFDGVEIIESVYRILT